MHVTDLVFLNVIKLSNVV